MADADHISIPAEFWQTVSEDEFFEICDRNGLNTEQCARLWRLLGRQDAPPKEIAVLLNKSDVVNALPPSNAVKH